MALLFVSPFVSLPISIVPAISVAVSLNELPLTSGVWSLNKRKRCTEICERSQMWHCLSSGVFSGCYWAVSVRSSLTSPGNVPEHWARQQAPAGIWGWEGPAWLPSWLTVLCWAAVGRGKKSSSTDFCPKKQHVFTRKYGSVSFQNLVSRHLALKGDCPSTFHSSK